MTANPPAPTVAAIEAATPNGATNCSCPCAAIPTTFRRRIKNAGRENVFEHLAESYWDGRLHRFGVQRNPCSGLRYPHDPAAQQPPDAGPSRNSGDERIK